MKGSTVIKNIYDLFEKILQYSILPRKHQLNAYELNNLRISPT